MAQEWFIIRGGKEYGPYTSQQLRDMAAKGNLQPNDLVRREDMPSPRQASTIKGLFPAPAMASPPPPPPPPPFPAPASPPLPAAPMAVQAAPLAVNPQQTPALWNPVAVHAWALLFTWVFGSILLAKNWLSLGDAAKARRAMIWCYATIPYAILLLLPWPKPMDRVFWFCGLAIWIVWSLVEALPQRKYVKDRLGNGYARKPWGKALGIATGSLLAFILVGSTIIVLTETDEAIQIVRKGSVDSYPNVPLGKAIDRFMGNPRWESGTGSSGQQLVTVKGPVTFKGNHVQAALQFFVDTKTRRFEVHALEFNGIPQNNLIKLGLMTKICQEYRP